MTKHLQTSARTCRSVRYRRNPKGWTPERRARQAARARLTQPWRHATGPRTEAGKARVARNALRHGYRSQAWILRARRIRNAIRLCATTLLRVRAMRQQREVEALQESWSVALSERNSGPSGNAPVRFMSLIS